ncbi:MAG: hypothetical protein DDT28_00738 [Dehalococcoidia bacterium]|nr:hypothetical protein [Chloroflexota bacterium]
MHLTEFLPQPDRWFSQKVLYQGLQDLLVDRADMDPHRSAEFDGIRGDTVGAQEPAEGKKLERALPQRQAFIVDPVAQGLIKVAVYHALDLSVVLKG